MILPPLGALARYHPVTLRLGVRGVPTPRCSCSASGLGHGLALQPSPASQKRAEPPLRAEFAPPPREKFRRLVEKPKQPKRELKLHCVSEALSRRVHLPHLAPLSGVPVRGGGRQPTDAVVLARLLAAPLGRLPGLPELLLLLRGGVHRAALKRVVPPALPFEPRLRLWPLLRLLLLPPLRAAVAPPGATVGHLLLPLPLLRRSGFE